MPTLYSIWMCVATYGVHLPNYRYVKTAMVTVYHILAGVAT